MNPPLPKKILIVSGEPSGDLHASNLVKDLKSLKPNLQFFGLGGRLSREAGVDISFDIAKLALVGLIEVWKNIFTIGKAYKALLKKIDDEKPRLAILVDYPGFNLRLSKELKARSIPVIYYISPQIWAWGKDRIAIIKRCVTKMVVFFKFEEELYSTYGVEAEFVGHPLLDVVKTDMEKGAVLSKYRLSGNKTTIALLPGSRTMEVEVLLPIMAGACKAMNERTGKFQFVVAKHPDLPMSLYEDAAKDYGLDIRIVDGDTYNILGAADFAVVASGTATLETAIIGTPFVITYKANLLTFLLYKFVARIKHVGLVNIIANREIVPEFIQFDAAPEKIAGAALEYLNDKEKISGMVNDLKDVGLSLGAPGAHMRAARAILQFLE